MRREETFPRCRLQIGGGVVYLLLAAVMILRATPAGMQARALREDEGRRVVLAGVILATLACLAAIVLELVGVQQAAASLRVARLDLLHCVLAYAFNTTLLALTINIASGLL